MCTIGTFGGHVFKVTLMSFGAFLNISDFGKTWIMKMAGRRAKLNKIWASCVSLVYAGC